MIKIHGTQMSRAGRVLWCAEELGLKYEHVPTAVAQAKSPEHLKLNPNGHIPALEDDGLVLWESMAINLYLAEKYGQGKLWPSDVQGHAKAYQWSFWAMTEVEPNLITILRNRVMAPPEQRDEKAAQAASEALKAPLKVLDGALKGREYLVGNSFSIADLNVASVWSFGVMMKYDMSSAPAMQAWVQKCLGREANKKVRSLK